MKRTAKHLVLQRVTEFFYVSATRWLKVPIKILSIIKERFIITDVHTYND